MIWLIAGYAVSSYTMIVGLVWTGLSSGEWR